jgi:large subunit ribosomal protein L10
MKTTKVNPQKTALVSSLSESLKKSKSVAVVDYKGLKVSQATALRKAVKKAGGEVLVTKNTLFKIALTTYNPQLITELDGPSAFVFSYTDETSAPKAIADFAKTAGLPTFKMGILSDKVLSKDEISALASLPAKEILLAQMLGSLNSPLRNLAYNLNWPISQLVRTLDAIKQKK